MVFPFIALFHIGMSLYLAYDYIADPVEGLANWRPVIMALYALFWLFACDLKRWAALSYLALTTINLVVRFAAADKPGMHYLLDVLFPFDILCTFFVMFYFKKFE